MLCPTPKLDIINSDGDIDLSFITPPKTVSPFIRRKRELPTAKVPLKHTLGTWQILDDIRPMVHSRQKRQQYVNHNGTNGKINNETLEFYVGFLLDGVPEYVNLSNTLPEYSRLNVYMDPALFSWTEEMVVKSDKRMFEIKVITQSADRI